MDPGKEQYHLQELQIAQDPGDARHIMPRIAPTDRRILDVGCGAGQTLIASKLGPTQVGFGVDVDLEALALGRRLAEDLCLVQARAEELPFPDESFDLVISRVTLPLTEMPQSVPEISRVLRPGGRCWLVLHPLSYTLRQILRNLARGQLKGVAFHLYALANGVSFHLSGRQFPFPLAAGRRFESFQTRRGIERVLVAAGMTEIEVRRHHHLEVTARKAPAAAGSHEGVPARPQL